MELIGRAHGKLLLFGEHAVVYGYPALGFSLPLTTCVTLSDTPAAGDAEHRILLDRLVERWPPDMRERWKRTSYATRIASTVPIGRGFGSSAALTGALARAFGQSLQPPPEDAFLWRLAHQAEHEFHGHPSGVDTALALGRGLTTFLPQEDNPPRLRSLTGASFALVAGSLPRVADAKSLIAGMHGKRDQQPERTGQHLARLGDLAARAIVQVETTGGDCAAALGALARDAQEILRQLGLSIPRMDDLLQRGQAAGAQGGKLSGAGGGGAFVLFCATANQARQVQDALARHDPAAAPDLQSYFWDGRGLAALP